VYREGQMSSRQAMAGALACGDRRVSLFRSRYPNGVVFGMAIPCVFMFCFMPYFGTRFFAFRHVYVLATDSSATDSVSDISQ